MPKHRKTPVSVGRKAVNASSSVLKETNTIHFVSEVDVHEPRRLLKELSVKKGESLSFTAYIVACLARTMKDYPEFNAYIRGGKMVELDELTISVLMEQDHEGQDLPEPYGIRDASTKGFYDIHKEIRSVKQGRQTELQRFSRFKWFRLIPSSLLRFAIKMALRSPKRRAQFGSVAVSAIGMYCKESLWLLPSGCLSVLVAVGSIVDKVVEHEGQICSREHLCLTLSFDHDIADGAPAARFISDFTSLIKSGELLGEGDIQKKSQEVEAVRDLTSFRYRA